MSNDNPADTVAHGMGSLLRHGCHVRGKAGAESFLLQLQNPSFDFVDQLLPRFGEIRLDIDPILLLPRLAVAGAIGDHDFNAHLHSVPPPRTSCGSAVRLSRMPVPSRAADLLHPVT